jgi:lysophospholipase L1-like esterase
MTIGPSIVLGLGARSRVGGITAALTLASLSRPALTLAEFYNAFGDSTTFGVGSPTGEDWPNKFRAIAAGPTDAFNGGTGGNNGASIVEIGNGGVGGENSASVTARVTGLSPSFTAQLGRNMFYGAGLNDYNTGVSGFTRVWPEQVQANYATAAAAVTGGKKMVALLAVPDNFEASGTRLGADHRFHFLDMVNRYNELAFDLGRYLRFVRTLEAPSGTADADALAEGYVPYTYRGITAGTDFDGADFADITGTVNPTDLNFPESTIYWQSTTAVPWRKLGASGTDSWVLVDGKHFSKYGNVVIARVAGDIALALEGNGPPVCPPARLRVAADAANGATVGTLKVIGTATRYALRTYADGAVTDFAISPTGVITKNTASALTDGVTELVVVAENANGVLLSPVDIYVARPSTETAPELRPIVSPFISIGGRFSDAMATGRVFSYAFYFNATARADQQLVLMGRTGTPSQPLSIQLLSNGRVRVTVRDSTNTAQTIDLSTTLYNGGAAAWIVGSFDFTTGSTRSSAFFNETAQTVASLTLTNDIQLADAAPIFLASNEVREYRSLINPFNGSIGYLGFWDGYIDWSVDGNRRALYDAAGVPATRTPYAAVGGLVPKFEQWGRKGDWAWGTPDGSYSTKMLSAAHRIRTVMS